MVQQECVDKRPMSASVLIRRCLEDRQTGGYCRWPLPQGSHLACSPVPSWPTLDLPPWPPPTVYLTTSYPGTEATSPTFDGERPPSLSFCLSRYVTILTLPGTGTTWGGGSRHDFLLGKNCVASPELWSALLDPPRTWRFQSRGRVS